MQLFFCHSQIARVVKQRMPCVVKIASGLVTHI